MKIGIVGTGLVGSTAAYAMVMNGVGREIVLVDLNKERAQAEADDILHAVPFAHNLRVRAGEYGDLDGAKVVIMAAGVNQKPGETRLELLERNMKVFQTVIPQILDNAPDAVLVIATNPVDVMTHVTSWIAADYGIPSQRIVGSGTTLDTARFRSLLGQALNIDSTHVHAYVIGEHGDSEVLAWSQVNIGNIDLEAFVQLRGHELSDEHRHMIDQGVRGAAYSIIQGKGATYYGVGSALARITRNILSDRRAIMTLCTPTDDIAGVRDVTVSLPRLIGGDGILETFHLPLNDVETDALHDSAALIRGYIDKLDALRQG
jgi:L-lactate dehydrogenase